MSSNQTRWTPAQRLSVAADYIDGDRSMSLVIESAQRGEIRHPETGEVVEYPRRIPKDTARQWVKSEQRRRDNQPQPARARIESALDAALKLATEELQQESKAKVGERDMTRVKAITGALKDADALRQSLEQQATPSDQPTVSPAPTSTKGQQLVEAARQRTEKLATETTSPTEPHLKQVAT